MQPSFGWGSPAVQLASLCSATAHISVSLVGSEGISCSHHLAFVGHSGLSLVACMLLACASVQYTAGVWFCAACACREVWPLRFQLVTAEPHPCSGEGGSRSVLWSVRYEAQLGCCGWCPVLTVCRCRQLCSVMPMEGRPCG